MGFLRNFILLYNINNDAPKLCYENCDCQRYKVHTPFNCYRKCLLFYSQHLIINILRCKILRHTLYKLINIFEGEMEKKISKIQYFLVFFVRKLSTIIKSNEGIIYHIQIIHYTPFINTWKTHFLYKQKQH